MTVRENGLQGNARQPSMIQNGLRHDSKRPQKSNNLGTKACTATVPAPAKGGRGRCEFRPCRPAATRAHADARASALAINVVYFDHVY